MSDPIAGEVTRPDSFDPEKDYALVIARGDEWLGDYDIGDLQRILRADQAALFSTLFVEGSVLLEAGGTIGTPIPGVNIGQDALGSGGAYVGIETQLYTVTITAGGPGGIATFAFKATGGDNPRVGGTTFPVTAIAPDLSTALGAPATYGHALGTLGVVVYFVNPNGVLEASNSWVVQATYGGQSPVAAGGGALVVADLLLPVNGRVHRVKGATLAYSPSKVTGIDVVYAVWTRTVITHADDPNLRDPLSDTPQAWRERWRIVLSATDPSSTPLGASELERRVFAIYRWDRATNVVSRIVERPYAINLEQTQGPLPAERLLNVPQNELLRGFLGRRTSGAHGSYVARPLPPAPRAAKSTNAASPGKIRVSVFPFYASVEGLDIITSAPIELEVDQATDTAAVAAEPHVYQAANDPFTLNKAVATNRPQPFPVAAVQALTAEVAVVAENVTRGGSSADTLAKTPVISVSAVQRLGTTFATPADYSQVGNQIVWVSGHGPTAGQIYTVDYHYQKTMVQGAGQDYVLVTAPSSGLPASAVSFTGLPGDKPVTGTTFQVTYTYYLARTDAVIVRPSGSLDVVRGLPAESAQLPTLPLRTLPYVRVDVPPNSVQVFVRKFDNDAVPMTELNRIKARLDQLEHNLALQDLFNQARAKQTARFLDIFADDFKTTLLADLAFSKSGVTFDATLDTEVEELTLPFDQVINALVRTAVPVGEPDVRSGASFFTLPYTHELAIDSSAWSEDYPVNPYADFRPEPPVGQLDPSEDFWIDTTASTSTSTRIVQNGRHESLDIVGGFSEVATRTTEVPAVFMRQIVVDVRGFHFVPGEKVRLKFDHKDVAFTADAPSTQGDSFTVIARASDPTHTYGDIAGHFTIPAAVPTGTVSVELWGDQAAAGSAWPANYTPRAVLAFSSNGVTREVASEVIVSLVQNDPVAQSVIFPVARMVSRVDIPFAAKAANKVAPVIIELRATDRSGRASTPIDTVLARTVIEAPEINVGDSSSNVVTFAEPVMADPNEFRTLVIRSASDAYRVYVARVGGPSRPSGGFIHQQQIAEGIFLDSSNNVDWTLRQDRDLRCKVYVAKMSALEARLYYGRVTVTDITGFYLAVDQVVPDGTSIEWQYSTDGLANGAGGKVWTTFVPFSVVQLPAFKPNVDVRAILRSSDPYVTPAVQQSNAALLVQSNKTAGKYISTAKALTAATTEVVGGVQLITPGGAQQTLFVSLDDGATWTSIGTPGSGLTLDGVTADGWNVYSFDKTGLSGPSAPLMRLRIDQTTGDKALRTRARQLFTFAK